MDVKIQSVHFDADKKLLAFVEEKVEKLTNLHSRIVNSEVILRVDKANDNGNKVAEIKLFVPGGELFAKKQCKTFEEATDQAVDALKTQIIKFKAKNN